MATPQRQGRRAIRGWSQPPASSRPLANAPPNRPPPTPTGRAQSSCCHSGISVGSIPRGNRGMPTRLLTRAAAEHTTRPGQIRLVRKLPVSSSTMNSTPISGLLKPPARPAAAPIASREPGLIRPARPGAQRCSVWATAAPTCTTGPSLPRGSRARLAALQRPTRATVGRRPSSSAAALGCSRLSMVWGIPDPAPLARMPFCRASIRGTTASGARAISRLGSCQEPPS